VIDGFRRIRALFKPKQEVVAAIAWPTGAVDALIELGRTHRRSSRAILEEGWLIEVLVDQHEVSLSELALRFGRSKTWVHSRLSLVRQLPEVARRRVLAGELSGYVASRIVVPFARANADLVEPFCQCGIDHGLSSRQAEIIYQYLVRVPDPAIQKEILARPQRVLAPEGAEGHRARGARGDGGLAAVDRLEHWCRHTHAVHSALGRLLSSGASEDATDQLARVWRDNQGVVRQVVRQPDELEGPSAGTSDRGGR